MNACKYIAHLWHINSHLSASPDVRLVEEEESSEVPDTHRVFSLRIGMVPSQAVLKTNAIDRRKLLVAFHNEYCGSRSNTTKKQINNQEAKAN
ncbi:hypothetical protein TNCV_2401601 [Trichonephila clavipes]|nr:hypothetical protein TNCV_2401601 [Trichonephila clavipes]